MSDYLSDLDWLSIEDRKKAEARFAEQEAELNRLRAALYLRDAPLSQVRVVQFLEWLAGQPCTGNGSSKLCRVNAPGDPSWQCPPCRAFEISYGVGVPGYENCAPTPHPAVATRDAFLQKLGLVSYDEIHEHDEWKDGRIEELKAALRKYGRHEKGWICRERGCDCGLEAVLLGENHE